MQQVILSGVLYTQLLDELRTLVRGEMQNTLSTPVKTEAEPTEELLTVREVLGLLSVCAQTVHEYKRQGILPFYKISGRTYLLSQAVRSGRGLTGLSAHNQRREGY